MGPANARIGGSRLGRLLQRSRGHWPAVDRLDESEREARLTFLGRIWRVLRLDASVYREVAKDNDATRQAILIYLLPALLVAVATFFVPEERTPITGFGITVLLVPVLAVSWTSIVRWAGARVVGRPTFYGDLFRTLGFAATAALLFVPIAAVGVSVHLERVALPSGWAERLGISAAFLASIWLAASLMLAIRESFKCRTGEAIRTLVGAIGLPLVIWALLDLIVPYYVLRYFYRRFKRPGGPAREETVPSRLILERMATRRQRYRRGTRAGWGIRRRRWA